MKSDVESLSPTRVKMTVDLPAAELTPYVDAAYKKIAGSVNIPGFRRGKVPARIIEQRFGRGAVLEEAVNEAIPKAYEKAVEEAGVFPVGQPEIDVKEFGESEDLSFTAEVDIRPEFELPDYSTLTVTVDSAVPSDEDVAEQLDSLRARFATLVEVDRPAAEGDVLLIDIAGECEGAEVADLAAQALSFDVGGEEMLPGFTEAVLGSSAGEVRKFSFPAEAGEYAGKEIDVTVTVNKVRERDLPPADDDFAQLASEFDTIDELTDDIRNRVSRVKRLEQGMQARALVHDALLDLVDIPLPDSLVQSELADHFHDGHGDDEHKAEFETEARARIKSTFLLDKVADVEKISVSQEEISAWLIQQASRYQMSPDQFADALVKAGQVQVAISEARRAKALAVVMEKATIVDEAGNVVDLEKLNTDLEGSLS